MRVIKKNNILNEGMFAMGGGGMDPTLFAGSAMVQGTSTGYKYEILPFNTSLQQSVNKVSNYEYIYPGCTVKGYGLKHPDKQYKGQVYRIVKNEKGEIMYVYIKTEDTNRFVPIRVDDDFSLVIYKEPRQVLKHSVFESSEPTEYVKKESDTTMHLLECADVNGKRFNICLDAFESPRSCIRSLMKQKIPNNMVIISAHNIPKCYMDKSRGSVDDLLMNSDVWKFIKTKIRDEVKNAVAEYFDGIAATEEVCKYVPSVLKNCSVIRKGKTLGDFAKNFITKKGWPCDKCKYEMDEAVDYERLGEHIKESFNWIESPKYMILLPE